MELTLAEVEIVQRALKSMHEAYYLGPNEMALIDKVNAFIDGGED